MQPTFFKSQAEFRRWLDKNHGSAPELWVGFYKSGSREKVVSYKEALDEALCFGWIDGVRKTIDDKRWTIRFTPRKPNSLWSKVNIARAGELERLGLMRPAGLEAFRRAAANPSRYSYEEPARELAPEYERVFRRTKSAWAFWEAQPPSYRRLTTAWVMSAKKEETRKARLEQLILDSVNGERIRGLRRPQKKGD